MRVSLYENVIAFVSLDAVTCISHVLVQLAELFMSTTAEIPAVCVSVCLVVNHAGTAAHTSLVMFHCFARVSAIASWDRAKSVTLNYSFTVKIMRLIHFC